MEMAVQLPFYPLSSGCRCCKAKDSTSQTSQGSGCHLGLATQDAQDLEGSSEAETMLLLPLLARAAMTIFDFSTARLAEVQGRDSLALWMSRGRMQGTILLMWIQK